MENKLKELVIEADNARRVFKSRFDSNPAFWNKINFRVAMICHKDMVTNRWFAENVQAYPKNMSMPENLLVKFYVPKILSRCQKISLLLPERQRGVNWMVVCDESDRLDCTYDGLAQLFGDEEWQEGPNPYYHERRGPLFYESRDW